MWLWGGIVHGEAEILGSCGEREKGRATVLRSARWARAHAPRSWNERSMPHPALRGLSPAADLLQGSPCLEPGQEIIHPRDCPVSLQEAKQVGQLLRVRGEEVGSRDCGGGERARGAPCRRRRP